METTKIADKDKLYIVYYINVSSMQIAKARAVVAEMSGRLKGMFDDTVNVIVVPVREGDSRVEMFNADKTTSEENAEKLNRVVEAMNKFILQNLKK